MLLKKRDVKKENRYLKKDLLSVTPTFDRVGSSNVARRPLTLTCAPPARCDRGAGGAPGGGGSECRAGRRRGGGAGLGHRHRHHGLPVRGGGGGADR